MGDLSQHFDSAEFSCHHCRTLPWYGIDPELVRRLELVRSRIRRPLVIVSGYRCDEHNAAVGGARRSMHVQGRAADIRPTLLTLSAARAAGFSGVGLRNGWAVHLDVRWQLHTTTWEY